MSGIIGIWNWDGRPVESSLLGALSGLLAHRGADGEGRWSAGEIGFAFQNFWTTPESVGDEQPLVFPAESVVLFDGRLDNREDLMSDLEGGEHRISSASSDGALVSAAYRRFGERFAERLKGDFAVAVYDIRQRKLFLARDAIGIRPLYFAQIGGTFLCASEVKPILAHPAVKPRPNGDTLAAALLACFGQEKQGWTFFDGVSSVLPGQLVTVDRGAVSKRIYWDLTDPQPIRYSRFEEYAEAFRDHFERAVERRLRSAYPVAVAVSGGLDSSSVYCMAQTLRRKRVSPSPEVVGVSMEVAGEQADERVFLHEIEQKYQTRIHRIPTKVRYATGSLCKAFRDMEAPYFRASVNSEYPFHRAVRALGARVQLSGLFGDQMVANTDYWIDLAGRFRWITVSRDLAEYVRWTGVTRNQAARWLLKDFGRYYTPAPLWRLLRNTRRQLTSDRSWYTPQFRERARRAEIAQQFVFPGKTAYQTSIYGLVRPMYYTQGLECFNKIEALNGLESTYPFFDRDLISFLLAIPGGVTCRGGVPKAILRKAMQGILPAAIAGRRGKAEITRELSDSMDREFLRFSRYFQGDILSVGLGYVDEARLKRALPALRGSMWGESSQPRWNLGDIFGLELWLQAFFGTKLDLDQEEVTSYDEK